MGSLAASSVATTNFGGGNGRKLSSAAGVTVATSTVRSDIRGGTSFSTVGGNGNERAQVSTTTILIFEDK